MTDNHLTRDRGNHDDHHDPGFALLTVHLSRFTAMNESTVVILDDTLKRFGGCVAFPKVVLRDPNIVEGAKIAYGFLLIYAWEEIEQKMEGKPNSEKKPIPDRLQLDMGASESKARRFINALLDRGLITTKRFGLNKPNRYFIEPLKNCYPDNPEWSNLTTPAQPVTPILTIPEWSNLTTPDRQTMREWSNLTIPELLKMTTQDGGQNGEFMREWSNLTTPNVNDNVNANVNVTCGQLDLSGSNSTITALLDELSRASGDRYKALHLTIRMLEELGDTRSLKFYWRVAQMMPEGIIEMTLSEVKDLRLSGTLRKTPGAAFTYIIQAHARERGIKLKTRQT